MHLHLRLALPCLLMLLTAACANRTMVALVPDQEGKVGRLAVTNSAGSVAVSAPYETTTVKSSEKPPTAPVTVGRDELNKLFAGAMSVQPAEPLHYLFYFTKEETPRRESLELLPIIVAGIRERNSAYVSVIGYADTTGAKTYNVDLSLRRAIMVRDLLVEQGVHAVTLYPTWEGEENLLVPTADEVREPKNRAVEVVVR